MRILWVAGGSLVAVCLLGFGTLSAVSQLAHEETAFQQTYETTITTVDVEVDQGTIRVVGGDADTVTVTIEVSEGLAGTDHRQDLEDDRLVLRGDCPPAFNNFCEVSYTIEVPADVEVVARSQNGRISLSNLTASVRASSSNGPVEVDDVAGDVTLRSSNGHIAATNLTSSAATAETHNGGVRLAFTEPPTRVEARSRNGGVQVVLPDTPASYAVEAETHFGNVDTPIRTDPTSDRTITARTSRGSVDVRYVGG